MFQILIWMLMTYFLKRLEICLLERETSLSLLIQLEARAQQSIAKVKRSLESR
jgi:hypothetical protein